MIFRLSQKLNKKIDAGKLESVPADSNPYADWTCDLFIANRCQHILLTNTASLYSVIMLGVGISNNKTFVERALGAIRESLETDGLGFAYQKFIVPESDAVTFAKTLNRSVTGSMNDLIFHAKYWLIEEQLWLFDVCKKLNDIPFSPLKYVKPREAFKHLVVQQG